MSKRWPNLFIIGAGKCGTTALHGLLAQHPDICMSISKEPSFFSMDYQYEKGTNWYLRNWRMHSNQKYLGEASNSYSQLGRYGQTLNRMRKNISSSSKFIFCCRHPLQRSESDWMEKQKDQKVAFSKFLRENKAHFDKNLYYRTLSQYRKFFGTDAVHVVFFEDFIDSRAIVLAKICEFLEIDSSFDFSTNGYKRPSGQPDVLPNTVNAVKRSYVYDRFLFFLLPQKLKDFARSIVLEKREVSRPRWTRADFYWFRDQFETLTQDFLLEVGKPIDFWSWENPPIVFE